MLRDSVKGIAYCSYVFPWTDGETEEKTDINGNKNFYSIICAPSYQKAFNLYRLP